MTVSGGTVYVGGQFNRVDGNPQSNLAAYTVDQPTATLLSQFLASASPDGIELRWSFGEPGRVATVAVERAPAAAGRGLRSHPNCARYPMQPSLSIGRRILGNTSIG